MFAPGPSGLRTEDLAGARATGKPWAVFPMPTNESDYFDRNEALFEGVTPDELAERAGTAPRSRTESNRSTSPVSRPSVLRPGDELASTLPQAVCERSSSLELRQVLIESLSERVPSVRIADRGEKT